MDIEAQFAPEIQFGGFSDNDGTVAFYNRVNALLLSDATALDVGCGRGVCTEDKVPYRRELRNLRGKCRNVIGIDVDPRGVENQAIDEFRIIEDGYTWPVEERSIDLCLSDMVLEHVDQPEAFFSELARVLKPGGYFCFRTANALGYVGLLARAIPNSWHVPVLKRAQPFRKAEDVFPTQYQCNTVWDLRARLARHGFTAHVYGVDANPSYLTFSAPLYALARLAQRATPNALRTSLFGFARKQ